MTYEGILDRRPHTTSAGDKHAAAAFVAFLTTVFADEALLATLTTSNRNYLYKLRQTWTLRAEGKDERWSTSGSKPGRPRVEKADKPGRIKRQFDPNKEEATYDDLSLRIIRRYRNIRPTDGEDL